MQINYLGHSCFRLRSSRASLLMDPFNPKSVGLPMVKTTADIATISHGNADHNDLDRIKNEDVFVIDAPGEYEVKGVSILGLPVFHDKDKKIPNIIYLVEMEGIRICHLGDLEHMLSDRQLDKLNGVDVLMIRVGTKKEVSGRLAVGETIKQISKIEPLIVLPMHYRVPQMTNENWTKLATLDEFVNEYGVEGNKKEKLVLSKSTLPEETQLVILEK